MVVQRGDFRCRFLLVGHSLFLLDLLSWFVDDYGKQWYDDETFSFCVDKFGAWLGGWNGMSGGEGRGGRWVDGKKKMIIIYFLLNFTWSHLTKLSFKYIQIKGNCTSGTKLTILFNELHVKGRSAPKIQMFETICTIFETFGSKNAKKGKYLGPFLQLPFLIGLISCLVSYFRLWAHSTYDNLKNKKKKLNILLVLFSRQD